MVSMRTAIGLVSCALLLLVVALPWPTVRAQPALLLSAGSARTGSDISITGTGFLPTDTTCAFSSPTSSALVSSSACVTQSGSLSGSFIIGNVLPGAYVVEASGNMGDSAQTIIEVTGGAQLQLSPGSGPPGQDVSILGTGFMPTDTTCTISSPSNPNPILPGSGACVITSGTARAFGSFLIGNVPIGEYVVRVTGSQGDSAQALIDVA